ncbi:MAG: hypothetical protein LW847_01210 [Burkholderiales bacterium]|jgi:hypothetical protein|nr:hypothetical protein [Burkholderiales bacterium]
MQRNMGQGKRSTGRDMTKEMARSHVTEQSGRHRGGAVKTAPKLVPGPAPKRGS